MNENNAKESAFTPRRAKIWEAINLYRDARTFEQRMNVVPIVEEALNVFATAPPAPQSPGVEGENGVNLIAHAYANGKYDDVERWRIAYTAFVEGMKAQSVMQSATPRKMTDEERVALADKLWREHPGWPLSHNFLETIIGAVSDYYEGGE